ncbi:MAG: hypothetical protein QMD10_11625 [Desulfitobacteriaceae bacterium]|nr:hypothetical protein [Desulfitobacteriaceae bacterium]
MPIDWKKLLAEWDTVPADLKRRIEALFREKPKDKLAELFKREPDAIPLYEHVTGVKWVPPPVLTDREVELLWADFSRKLMDASIDPTPYRKDFDAVIDRSKGFDENEQAVARKAEEIIRIAKPPPPPKPPPPVIPPVPPKPPLAPRIRRFETFKCWVEGCPEMVTLDRNLQIMVSTIPVLKAWTPRGGRVEPLLMFPPLFYWMCETHRYEKFGYRDIYDALGYLLAETRSSMKRLTVTKATLREIGLDDADIAEIQLREARWLGKLY